MKRRRLLKQGAVAVTGATTSVIAAPAVAKSRIELTMVSSWPRDFPGVGTGAQRLAESITAMSDGRINVQYFAGGERVSPFDAFDAVASGNADAYHAAEYYWKGKHPGFAYFASVPFGLTASEINAWVAWGGGQELWDELGAEFGVKGLLAGNTGVQMGGWFRKEIDSAEDFKGLKMRIPGIGGDVMAKLGASPVSLPGSQIYENLISGAIDATEWIGPWNDSFLKFYEAARYYYYPGLHEPGTAGSLGINKKVWDSLSRSDQALVRAAAAQANDTVYAEYNARNGEALERLVTEEGVQLRDFSDDVVDRFGEAAQEVFEEVRDHSELAARIHESFLQARRSLGGWSAVAEQAYVRQRNRVLGV